MTEKFIKPLREAQTSEDIISILRQIVDHVGMEHYAYWAINIPGRLLKEGWSFSELPNDWDKEYWEKGYHMTDPVAIKSPKHFSPIAWGTEEYLAGLNTEEMKVFTDAAKHGIKMGIMVPIHGPGSEFAGFSVMAGSDESEQDFIKAFPERSYALGAIAPYIQDSLRVVLNVDELASAATELSPREIECLSWIADGKTFADIAQILGISRHTVITHINRSKDKLGVNTTHQAVAIVLQSGLSHHEGRHPY